MQSTYWLDSKTSLSNDQWRCPLEQNPCQVSGNTSSALGSSYLTTQPPPRIRFLQGQNAAMINSFEIVDSLRQGRDNPQRSLPLPAGADFDNELSAPLHTFSQATYSGKAALKARHSRCSEFEDVCDRPVDTSEELQFETVECVPPFHKGTYRKRRHLDAAQRKKAKIVRRMGACLRCRVNKESVENVHCEDGMLLNDL